MAELCGLHGQEEGESQLYKQQDTGKHLTHTSTQLYQMIVSRNDGKLDRIFRLSTFEYFQLQLKQV